MVRGKSKFMKKVAPEDAKGLFLKDFKEEKSLMYRLIHNKLDISHAIRYSSISSKGNSLYQTQGIEGIYFQAFYKGIEVFSKYYSVLDIKNRFGSDFIFDAENSISI